MTKFQALAHECPRCGAKPHKACRKLNRIGPTRFLRVPHVERRDITNETASGRPRRACPCHLHRTPPIEPIACICECDHDHERWRDVMSALGVETEYDR